MKCKCNSLMTAHGFKGHNLRYDCTKCNLVKIPSSSIDITSNWIFSEWITKEEYYPEWIRVDKVKDNRVDKKALTIAYIGGSLLAFPIAGLYTKLIGVIQLS